MLRRGSGQDAAGPGAHGGAAAGGRGHWRVPNARSGLGLATAAALIAAGLALVLVGWGGQHPAAPAPPSPGRQAAGGAVRPARPLEYSSPMRVAIPAINVSARVIPLGLTAAGTVEVPALSQPSLVSWFDKGPSPGQRGPAALYGHVAVAATGPAVFFRLGDLRPGDVVRVTRADHWVAVFRVDRIAVFRKDAFPTREVYGPTPDAELRLITCGGPFDQASGSYLDNVVAFARLSGTLPPRPGPRPEAGGR